MNFIITGLGAKIVGCFRVCWDMLRNWSATAKTCNLLHIENESLTRDIARRDKRITDLEAQLGALSLKLTDCEVLRDQLETQVTTLKKKIRDLEKPTIGKEEYRTLQYLADVDCFEERPFDVASEMGLKYNILLDHIAVLEEEK